MDNTLWFIFALNLLIGLAAPWGFQILMKRLFHRRIGYLVSFLIFIATSMIATAIFTHFFPWHY